MTYFFSVIKKSNSGKLVVPIRVNYTVYPMVAVRSANQNSCRQKTITFEPNKVVFIIIPKVECCGCDQLKYSDESLTRLFFSTISFVCVQISVYFLLLQGRVYLTKPAISQ